MTDATNALLPCPCGKTPTALVIVQHGDSKHAHCAGNCCGEWEVEFRTNFHHPTSAEAKRRAVSRWNDAHRQPTASAGMVVVPREPTEAMLDAGRTAVMARDCSGPKWGPADHFEATGFDTTGIPSRLLEGRYKMSKEWGAELVYAAMLAAHESQPTVKDSLTTESPNRQVREDSQGLGEPGRLPPDVEAVAYAIWLYEDAALMYADVQDPRDIPAESLKYCREKWLKDWLPALHENHFGDCIKVCTACTRCHMERLVGEASLLLAKSPPADTTPDVSERIPSKERGCDGKTDFGSHYESAARSLSKRHCKRYGVYRCPHCQGTHLTTKLEKADQYAPLLYVTPEPAENVDGE